MAGRNFKSNTGHFNINFEYKMHLNFGGNFSNKKVCLIVHKIWYISECGVDFKISLPSLRGFLTGVSPS